MPSLSSRAAQIASKLWVSVFALAACAGLVGAVHAQSAYPAKPIRLIVPFPPGGGTDMIARAVAQKVADQNKWNVIVENRPGAGGNLGVDAASKADPDGYTLVMGQTSNLAINPTLYKKLPYDPLKDLAPVALVSSSPIVIAVPVNSRFKNFGDVVAASKGKPEALTLGYPGNGTVAHLAGELAENAAGIQLRHIPYKGAAQALTDLMGGQIDMYMSSVPSVLGHVRNGKLKVIAITSSKRSAQLPDVPTLDESGYKGFEAVTWFGVLAPANTPPAIVVQLSKAINQALKQPDVAEKLQSEGGEVLGGTPEQFSTLLRAELPRWAKIVKESGATLD